MKLIRRRWSPYASAGRRSWTRCSFLTEEQRTVVVYRCALGYSPQRWPDAGKPENAVRGLQFRALASLSRHLGAAERRQMTRAAKEQQEGKERRSYGTTR